MHRIQLEDQLYQEAQRRAAEAGFENVEAYIADVVQHDLEEAKHVELLFTQERLAQIDRAAAQIEAGQGLSMEQVDIELAKRRDEWLREKS